MRKPFYNQSHKAWFVHHDGKPEFSEELEDRVALLFDDFVEAVVLPARVHLRARESGVGVHL